MKAKGFADDEDLAVVFIIEPKISDTNTVEISWMEGDIKESSTYSIKSVIEIIGIGNWILIEDKNG